MALGRELPDDLVADILRRLPPHSLAVSRCACRAWRDLIGDRRLLRTELLPHTVGGIFINYRSHQVTELLARPTTGPSISSDLLQFIPGIFEAIDHCNGLLLWTPTRCHHDLDCVANPATRQWAWLPLPPQHMRKKQGFRQGQCLVYDPAVSPHYHVFLIGSNCLGDQKDHQHKSALQVYVYSSQTGRWEERWFAPEVPVVETIIALDVKKYRVYWRGRLYLLCENGHALRLSISNASYRLIPTPASGADLNWYHGFLSLGRSEKGVYCAFEYDWNQLRIFLLNESCGQIVWELRHNVDLYTCKLQVREVYGDQPNGPWILEDIKYYKYSYSANDKDKKVVVKDNFEWNSDDDNVLSTEDMDEGRYTAAYSIGLLGFHPYKEVVFLNADLSRAVAYYWNTSKFQDLGNICPKHYLDDAKLSADIETSFIYTPCWMEDLPQNSLEAPIED